MQGLVLEAAARVLGEPVKVTGASRTDAGVHALGQVASLTTAAALAPARLARGAQRPAAAGDPRARPRARRRPASTRAARPCGKRYGYLIDRGPQSPIRSCGATPGTRPFALDERRDGGAALGALRGKHDFSRLLRRAGPRIARPSARCASARVVCPARRLAICSPPTASSITWSATSWAAWSRSGGAPGRRLDGRAPGRPRPHAAGPTAPAQGLAVASCWRRGCTGRRGRER